jgi:hypothetical protein
VCSLVRTLLILLAIASLTLILAFGITAAAASAAITPAARTHEVRGIHGHTCSYTAPEYSINSGGAELQVTPGSPEFSAFHQPGGGMEAPYITEGYYNSKNTDSTPDYGGCNGYGSEHWSQPTESPVMPVQLGHQGHITSSAHDISGPGYAGDTGYDIWFNPSPRSTTYDEMANGGTEIMLWLSSTGLPRPASYRVRIDGLEWGITAGLAANGHGRTRAHPRGWTVVNFILNNHRNGTVSVRNLHLNPFFTYAIRHGELGPRDYLISIDQGGEMYAGTLQAHSTVSGLE